MPKRSRARPPPPTAPKTLYERLQARLKTLNAKADQEPRVLAQKYYTPDPTNRKEAAAVAEKLGTLLGLTDDTWKEVFLSGDVRGEEPFFLAYMSKNMEDRNLKHYVYAYFAGLYLPIFIRAYTARHIGGNKTYLPLTLLYIELLFALVKLPSFNHYLRRHPDGGEIWVLLVRDLVEHPCCHEHGVDSWVDVLMEDEHDLPISMVEAFHLNERFLVLANVLMIGSSSQKLADHLLFSPSRIPFVSQLLERLKPLQKEAARPYRPSNPAFQHDCTVYVTGWMLKTLLDFNLAGKASPNTAGAFFGVLGGDPCCVKNDGECSHPRELNAQWLHCPMCPGPQHRREKRLRSGQIPSGEIC